MITFWDQLSIEGGLCSLSNVSYFILRARVVERAPQMPLLHPALRQVEKANLLDIYCVRRRRRPFRLFPIEVRLIQIRTSSDPAQSQSTEMIFPNLNEYSAGHV